MAQASDHQRGCADPRRRPVTHGNSAICEESSGDPGFNATAVWRGRNLEGYLERKLHRQWRNRGS